MEEMFFIRNAAPSILEKNAHRSQGDDWWLPGAPGPQDAPQFAGALRLGSTARGQGGRFRQVAGAKCRTCRTTDRTRPPLSQLPGTGILLVFGDISIPERAKSRNRLG